jgi:hypothetical protein
MESLSDLMMRCYLLEFRGFFCLLRNQVSQIIMFRRGTGTLLGNLVVTKSQKLLIFIDLL